MAYKTPMSKTRHMADHILKGRLEELVTDRRAKGRSWEQIAREFWAMTNGGVDVTGHTLHNWFRAS